jgi:hypothetical protein
MFPPLGVPTLAAAPRWVPDPAGGGAVTQLGPDVRLRLRPADDAGDGDDDDIAADRPAADRTAARHSAPAGTAPGEHTSAAPTSAGTTTGTPATPSTPQHNQE